MKKFYFLSVSLLCTVTMYAQTPGGVSGSALWLKGNAGASATSWTDFSANSNTFLQASVDSQPVLTANTFNFNAALSFNGTSSYLGQPSPTGLPTGNSDKTIFLVANATATDNFRWAFAYGDVTALGGTVQMGNHFAGLTNAFFGFDVTTNSYWNATGNSNGALASFVVNANNGFQYDRGTQVNSAGVGTMFTTSANATIGAIALSGGVKDQFWGGSIGEVIMFPSALSDADRNKVESYLALKYGFTMGTTAAPINYTASDGTTIFWTASAIYQNDVFGIGADAAGSALTQQQSNSMNSGNGDGSGQSGKGNLVLSGAAPLSDKQFLMIGNDAGSLAENMITTGQAPVAAVGSQRLFRNWKAQNTGAIPSVNLSFDLTGLALAGGTTAGNYRLMIDEDGDGDYNTGTVDFVKATGITANLLNFNGIVLNNAPVFTIITQASALLPALWQGFTATLVKNAATLVWQTSNEVNVDHYTVEYSANAVNFTPAGSVTAKNGTGINTYSLVQDNLPAGTRYYRIRRVDKDGNSVVSDIRSVRAGGGVVVLLRSNPIVKGRLELNIDVPQNQDAEIRVLNVAGKMLTQQHRSLTTGTNTVIANVTSAAAGIYFVQVQLGNQVISRKFVKQ